MKRITIHEARPICTGPQRPLTMPAIGLRAQEPRPMTFHEPFEKGAIGNAVRKAMEGETDPGKAAGKGLLTIAEQLDHIANNHTQLDKDGKKLLEDFTKAKENFDGLSSSVKDLQHAMQKWTLRLNNERANLFGDPVKRIESSEEQSTLLNAMVRANFVEKGIRLSDKHTEALKAANFEKVGDVWVEMAQKATITEGGTPGSTYIRTELDRNVYSTLPEYGIWGSLDVVPMGSKSMSIPVLTADPICKVIAEGGTITPDANIAGTSVTATAVKLITLVTLSKEILEDSEIDVTSQTLEQVGNAQGYRSDFCSFLADGTNDDTNGACTGILNFGTAVTAPSGATTVEGMDYADFIAVLLGIDVGAFKQMPRWWIHQFMLFRALSIRDNNGRPIFLTALEAPSAGAIGSLLGYPATVGNIMPTTNSTGATVAAFGSPKAFRVGMRKAVEFLTSEIPYFTTDLVATRARGRGAFKGKKATAIGVLKLA